MFQFGWFVDTVRYYVFHPCL